MRAAAWVEPAVAAPSEYIAFTALGSNHPKADVTTSWLTSPSMPPRPAK